MQRVRLAARFGAIFLCALLSHGAVLAAPYAALVMDVRTGEVLHSRNADTPLHPASLTKMMTLYVAFEAIKNGEVSLDTRITVSKNAAAQPPSKLYLKAGQKIELRYLIRAAAIKSANDAATAIGDALAGSEEAWAARMNRTAKALGMTKTHFINANGLTRVGHYSTARDMTILGRHLFYDYPEYYNLFSRRSADAGGKTVYNTNRKLLDAYPGADGIKTGYTLAAGSNLTASAERGGVRIIATLFGGTSSAARNAQVAKLLDLGFARAPARVAVRKPPLPVYDGTPGPATRPVGEPLLLARSARPMLRPVATPEPVVLAAVQESVADTLREVANAEVSKAVAASTASIVAPLPRPGSPAATTELAAAEPAAVTEPPSIADASVAAVVEAAAPAPVVVASAFAAPISPPPAPRPATITFSSTDSKPLRLASAETTEMINPRVSTSGGRQWGINVGSYNSQYEAERVLLKTALIEMETLDQALRKVVRGKLGWEANFVGLDEHTASLACQRLTARERSCETFGP